MDADNLSLNPVPLSKILPSPYHIVYAALLLAFSVPVTFAGAFLTLDRTRSFAPSNSLSTPTGANKAKFRLEGGVGGLLGGWLIGVHVSTLMALLIMNRTSAAALGGIQFLVVWLISALAVSVISGRWKFAAVPLIGLGGGVSFSLFVTVACHPEKLARNILLGVCGVISIILCLLPIPRVQHGAVRSASAWLGALGIVMSISILSGVSDWSNVWSRLWVSWDSAWGTGKEKGLSAAFGGLAAAGIAVDWILKRQFGENPDEKWDSYLANYAANLPNAHDRPGTFTPSVPFWKKIFSPQHKDPILFPPDKALLSTHAPLSPPPYPAGKLHTKSSKTRPWSGNGSKPLKKSNLDLSSDSGSSSDEEEFGDGKRYIPRPWAPRKDTQATSLSGVTLADSASTSSKGKHKGGVEKDLEKGEVVYSDGEEAAASIRSPSRTQKNRDTPGWTPEFIRRHSIGGRAATRSGTELEMKGSRAGESPPPGAVPVTPSLMRALDRVSQAQNEAYGGIISKGHTPHASTLPGHGAAGASTPGLPPVRMPTPNGGYDWAGFWRTVEEKTATAPVTQPKPTR